MTHEELRNLFKGILNRDDCTDTQADQFLGMGLMRTERLLKTQAMGKTVSITGVALLGPIPIPEDLLTVRSVRVNRVPIKRNSEANFDAEADTTEALSFILQGETLLISPALSEDDVVELIYMSGFTIPTDDTLSPIYATDIPDVIAYGGLWFAADHFMDTRKADFGNTYLTLVAEAQLFAHEQAMSGGLYITNPYGGI